MQSKELMKFQKFERKKQQELRFKWIFIEMFRSRPNNRWTESQYIDQETHTHTNAIHIVNVLHINSINASYSVCLLVFLFTDQ